MAPQDRVAVVTGASQGIGEAAARAFAAAGCHVALAARSEARLHRVAKEIEAAHGRRAVPLRCDVRSWEEVQAFARAVRQELGHADVLVNAAGVGIGGTLAEMPVEDLDETLATNLRGPMLVAKAFLPLLREDATILNIASVSADLGRAGLSAYGASKAGLVRFSEALGQEVAPRGIRVVAVKPGFVDTAMVEGAAYPAKDMVTPADLAALLVQLAAQPASAYVDEVVVWPRRLYDQ